MIAKYIVVNIISIISDDTFRICIGEPVLILKKMYFFFIPYQHITAYSSATNFTRLIPGNVCAEAESMLKPMKTLVLIQHHDERIL